MNMFLIIGRDASRREGWNECRIAAMHLNRKS